MNRYVLCGYLIIAFILTYIAYGQFTIYNNAPDWCGLANYTYNQSGRIGINHAYGCCFYNDYGLQECNKYTLSERPLTDKGQNYYKEYYKYDHTGLVNISRLNFN